MASHQVQAPNMTTVNAFWNVYAGNMNIGRWSEVTMPVGLKSVIGQEGIDIMEARFRNMIKAPVIVTEELDHGLIRIAPARNPLGHSGSIPRAQKTKPRTSNKAKVARPPNAFILYRQHHHPLVKAEYPNLHNNQISVILGTQWKHESNANKAQFAALASRLKVRHLQENPGYQYQPRKPSEKKRRIARKSSNKITTTTPIHSVANQTVPSVPADTKTSTIPVLASPAPSSFSAPMIAIPATASAPVLTATPANKNSEPNDILEFSKTVGGNAVVNLGDEDLNENQFAAMLVEYNNSIPAAPTQQATVSRQNAPPVLYNEPSEEAQNDMNFYSAMVDFGPFISSSTEMNEFFDFQAASLPSPY